MAKFSVRSLPPHFCWLKLFKSIFLMKSPSFSRQSTLFRQCSTMFHASPKLLGYFLRHCSFELISLGERSLRPPFWGKLQAENEEKPWQDPLPKHSTWSTLHLCRSLSSTRCLAAESHPEFKQQAGRCVFLVDGWETLSSSFYGSPLKSEYLLEILEYSTPSSLLSSFHSPNPLFIGNMCWE